MIDLTLPVRLNRRHGPMSRRHVLPMVAVLVGFALNFWAWTVLVQLEPEFHARFGMGPAAHGMLLAVPLVVAVLVRVPVGMLTDRYGPRLTFSVVTLFTAVGVGTLAAGDSLIAVGASSVLLGVAGTACVAGAPLVWRWCGPDRRGMAFGLMGVGLVGAAASGITSQLGYGVASHRTCLLVLAGVLAGYAVLAALFVRSPPVPYAGHSPLRAARGVLAVTATGRLAALYAVAVGGLTALVLYLPSYLRTQYRLSWTAAVWLTAAVVSCAAVAHVVGGWLADRPGQARALVMCYAGAAVLGLVQAFRPPLYTLGTPVMLGIGACLGAASGALIGLVARAVPPHQVGAAIGAVGAAGGLGATLPPILLSGVYDLEGSYAIGLTLLAGTSLAAAAYARGGPLLAGGIPEGNQDEADRTWRSRIAVVAVSAFGPGSEEEQDLLTALVLVAATGDLVVVYGCASDEARHVTPHQLIDGLRRCLPRRTVCGVLHEPDYEADVEYDIVADLVHDGAVVVVASPYVRPHRHAAAYSRLLHADRALCLVYDRADGSTTVRAL